MQLSNLHLFQLIKPSKDGYCPIRTGEAQFAASQDDTFKTFFGTGYLKSGEYDQDPMEEVDFKFQTTSSNGILVIAIDDDDPSLFQAMELSNGHVVFSYNMGYGYRQVRSKKLYDTGKLVSVKKKRANRGRYTLTVSSAGTVETLAENSPYYTRRSKFVDADYVYWGGIENRTMIAVNV